MSISPKDLEAILPRYSAWQYFLDGGVWPAGEPPKWAQSRDGRTSWNKASEAVIEEMMAKLQEGLGAEEITLLRSIHRKDNKKPITSSIARCLNCKFWTFRTVMNHVEYGVCAGVYGRARISISKCNLTVRAAEEVSSSAEIQTASNHTCSRFASRL